MNKKYLTYLFLMIIAFSAITLGNNTIDKNKVDQGVDDLNTNVCVDAWIVIVGDRSDHHLASQILHGVEEAYDILLDCGYTHDDIYYLVPDTSATTREDAQSTLTNIQYAIETWAPTKVGSNGELGIYMCDHGGSNYFCLHPNPDLSDSNFNTYLDNFEATSGTDRIFVIYDACTSGSFQNPVSDSDRIVVCSTDDAHSAYLSPVSPNDPMFSDSFWPAIQSGHSIGEAFEIATADIDSLGYGDAQFPTIDDNHDEIGHIVNAWGHLPSTGDGNDALNTYICGDCGPSFVFPPILYQIPVIKWFPFDPKVVEVPVWVVVQNVTPVDYVRVRVIPPNWNPPPIPRDWNNSFIPPYQNESWFDLTDNDGDGNYTGLITISTPDNNTEYGLNFIAGGQDGSKGPVEDSKLGLNGDGKAPEDTTAPTIAIANPLDGSTVSGIVNITAQGDDDQGLACIEIYVDDVLKKNATMPDYYPYDEVIYSWTSDDSQHTIKAVARDKAGNVASTSVIVNQVIPGFQLAPVIIGFGLIAITLYIFTTRKNNYRMKF